MDTKHIPIKGKQYFNMKTQATLWIDKKKEAPRDIESFLHSVFYKGKNKIQVIETAEIIIKHILDKGYNEFMRDEVIDTTNITKKQYYSILGRLKALGLIKKKQGNYILSNDFCKSLNRLKEYWENRVIEGKNIQTREPRKQLESSELTDKDIEEAVN